MPSWDFESLVGKVLSGEATWRERRRLNKLLAADSSLRQRYEELKTGDQALHQVGPLTNARNAAEEPIPEERLKRLLQVVRDDREPESRRPEPAVGTSLPSWLSGIRGWTRQHKAWAVVATAVLVVGCFLAVRFSGGDDARVIAYLVEAPTGLQVLRRGEPIAVRPMMALRKSDQIVLPAGTESLFITAHRTIHRQGPATIDPDELESHTGTPTTLSRERRLMFAPLQGVLTWNLLDSNVTRNAFRSGSGLTIYSPRAATATLRPMLIWRADPGKACDITIADDVNEDLRPWRANGVNSPLEFTSVTAWKDRPLKQNWIYRITISPAGNSSPVAAASETFVTRADARAAFPSTTLEKIQWIPQLLDSKATGDLLAVLLTLPDDYQDTELVLRLKLLAFGQLGFEREYREVAARLQTIATDSR